MVICSSFTTLELFTTLDLFTKLKWRATATNCVTQRLHQHSSMHTKELLATSKSKEHTWLAGMVQLRVELMLSSCFHSRQVVMGIRVPEAEQKQLQWLCGGGRYGGGRPWRTQPHPAARLLWDSTFLSCLVCIVHTGLLKRLPHMPGW